jgi:LysR family transcriptional activator of nhaA
MLAASRLLGVSQPTISVQIGELEKFFGKTLFERLGKSIELTDFGRTVFKYAEDIFSISSELVEVSMGRQGVLPSRIRVGVVDVIPKGVAFSLLKHLVNEACQEGCMLSVSEGTAEKLLIEMRARTLDFILSDSPFPPESGGRIFSRKIASLPVKIVGNSEVAQKMRRHFPGSLDGARILVPKRNTMLRHELDLWFFENKVQPKIVGEFDDTALMKEFARSGVGVMPMAGVPHGSWGLDVVGEMKGLSQNYFLLFPEKRNLDWAVKLLSKSLSPRK